VRRGVLSLATVLPRQRRSACPGFRCVCSGCSACAWHPAVACVAWAGRLPLVAEVPRARAARVPWRGLAGAVWWLVSLAAERGGVVCWLRAGRSIRWSADGPGGRGRSFRICDDTLEHRELSTIPEIRGAGRDCGELGVLQHREVSTIRGGQRPAGQARAAGMEESAGCRDQDSGSGASAQDGAGAPGGLGDRRVPGGAGFLCGQRAIRRAEPQRVGQ